MYSRMAHHDILKVFFATQEFDCLQSMTLLILADNLAYISTVEQCNNPSSLPNIQEAIVFVETITQGDESKIVGFA